MNKIYPFKFLDSYDEKDTGLFFGRDEEIEALYRMVFESNILLVYGASGTGKTSLIQCGLASKFQPHDWQSLFIRRGNNLNESLKEKITEAGGTTGTDDLARSFKTIYRSSFRPVYLIFDQFEELFIIGSKQEQDTFITIVGQIMQLEQPVKMIFSIREEYLGYLSGFEKAVPQIMRNKLRVEPMTLSKVQQVVVGFSTEKIENSLISLEKGKEDAIGENIFNKVKGIDKTQPIQLPYLQVFMDKLYLDTTHDESRKADALFTLAAVEHMGDIGDILREFLEKQVKSIGQTLVTDYGNVTTEEIWKILSPFATLEGTKEPISLPALQGKLPDTDQGLIAKTVAAFVKCRILRQTGDVYELAHDSLAEKVASNRSADEVALLGVERLIKSQLDIRKEARGLLQENQLSIVDVYWKQLEPRLSDDAKELINNSRQKILADKEKEKAEAEKERAEQRRKLRNTRRLVAVFVLIAVVMTGLTIWAIKQKDLVKQTSIKSQSMALAGQSVSYFIRSHDITKAFRYAQYAYEKDSNNADARLALYASIFRNNGLLDLSFYRHSMDHRAHVNSVVFSRNGKLLLTGSEDATAVLWDVATGRRKVVFLGHSGKVNSAVFSPDGRKVLTASADGTARIWDADTGKSLVVVKGNTELNAAVFSPDGKRVLTTSRSDDTADIWDAATGNKVIALAGHTKGIFSAVFSNDGRQVLTASKDGTAKLWDAATGREVQTFKGHTNSVFSAVFTPDGKDVVTASFDKTAKRWDTANGQLITTYRGHTAAVYNVTFSSDGKKMLTTSDDSTARMWDVATGKTLDTIRGHKDEVMSAVFSPDDRQILTASLDHTAKLWDAATGNELATLSGHTNAVGCAVFSPNGSMIATASNDYTAKVWDNVTVRKTHTLARHDGKVNSAVFSHDGKRVLSTSDDSTVKIWDIGTGKMLLSLKESDAVKSAVFSDDDKRLLIASGKIVAIWDMEAGKSSVIFRGHTGTVYSAAFSHDGKQVVTASADSSARVWNALTGDLVDDFKGTNVIFSAVFSKDGKQVLTASANKYAEIFRHGHGSSTTNGHSNWVKSAVYSLSENIILTASLDNTAQLAAVNITLTGHTSGVQDAVFSPDGNLILTASLDHTARLWDTPDRSKIAKVEESSDPVPFTELAILAEHTGDVNYASFSPDGKWVVTASSDSTIKLWHIYIPDIIRQMSDNIEDLSYDEKTEFDIGNLPRRVIKFK